VTHEGTAGDDDITGTDGRDVVWAGDGDDTIDTLTGDDVVCAGRGQDDVKTRGQVDTIWGGAGRDRIAAGSGDDTIYGEDGADRIFAGDQSDVANGNAGPDFIDMGGGHTSRRGDDGYGGLGRDTLKTYGYDEGSTPIHLYGNKGDDTLLGEQAEHNLDGGPGTDTCSKKATRKNCERTPG
jgi:Ca2+-binding RTX toxin-like protein